jgi:hypothetical protein
MEFCREFYDPETLSLMTRALKEAMRDTPGGDEKNTHMLMAGRIIAAVACGERDLEALKRAAVQSAN